MKDVNPFKDWNMRNGEYFKFMFSECTSFKNISALKSWDISNGKDFSGMFERCNIENIDEMKMKFGDDIL